MKISKSALLVDLEMQNFLQTWYLQLLDLQQKSSLGKQNCTGACGYLGPCRVTTSALRFAVSPQPRGPCRCPRCDDQMTATVHHSCSRLCTSVCFSGRAQPRALLAPYPVIVFWGRFRSHGNVTLGICEASLLSPWNPTLISYQDLHQILPFYLAAGVAFSLQGSPPGSLPGSLPGSPPGPCRSRCRSRCWFRCWFRWSRWWSCCRVPLELPLELLPGSAGAVAGAAVGVRWSCRDAALRLVLQVDHFSQEDTRVGLQPRLTNLAQGPLLSHFNLPEILVMKICINYRNDKITENELSSTWYTTDYHITLFKTQYIIITHIIIELDTH